MRTVAARIAGSGRSVFHPEKTTAENQQQAEKRKEGGGVISNHLQSCSNLPGPWRRDPSPAGRAAAAQEPGTYGTKRASAVRCHFVLGGQRSNQEGEGRAGLCGGTLQVLESSQHGIDRGPPAHFPAFYFFILPLIQTPGSGERELERAAAVDGATKAGCFLLFFVFFKLKELPS